MQSPILIEYVATKERQWRLEQAARARPVTDAPSPRKHVPLRLIVSCVLGLLVLGLLLVSQLDSALARPLPTCSQTSLSSIRPEISPPLPNLGKFCEVSPIHPPIADETADPQVAWYSLPGLAELWAIVFDLLADLAGATALPAAR